MPLVHLDYYYFADLIIEYNAIGNRIKQCYKKDNSFLEYIGSDTVPSTALLAFWEKVVSDLYNTFYEFDLVFLETTGQDLYKEFWTMINSTSINKKELDYFLNKHHKLVLAELSWSQEFNPTILPPILSGNVTSLYSRRKKV